MTAPFDPRADRQRCLSRFLRVSTVVVFVAALVAVLAPGRLGSAAARTVVVVLVATPLVRTLWLAVRWVRKGDLRFAVLATTLVGLVAAGVLVANA